VPGTNRGNSTQSDGVTRQDAVIQKAIAGAIRHSASASRRRPDPDGKSGADHQRVHRAPRPEDAWPILVALERVAGFLPGAMSSAVDVDDCESRAKIKVRPIAAE
jgi:hypothetical protein